MLRPRSRSRPAPSSRGKLAPLRILCLSAEVGVGHTAAAHALVRAIEQRYGFSVDVLDSYRFAAAPIAQAATKGYVALVRRLPSLYRCLRHPAERAAMLGPFRAWVGRYAARNLLRHLHGRLPERVVCTHPFACNVMTQFKQAYAPEVHITAVITDFTVQAFWVHPSIDRYVVAHHEMKAALVEQGVCEQQIDVFGIPIDERFGMLASADQAQRLRRQLGLPLDHYVVMLMGGGLGLGPLATLLVELGKLHLPLYVVVVAGHNKRYRAELEAYASSLPMGVKVLGFITNVHEYMQVSDLLMTKPGGLSCAEVLAAQVPTILTAPLPGPEEANAAYLHQHGAALFARCMADVMQLVITVLTNPTTRLRLTQGMRQIARPEAAATLANALCAPQRKNYSIS